MYKVEVLLRPQAAGYLPRYERHIIQKYDDVQFDGSWLGIKVMDGKPIIYSAASVIRVTRHDIEASLDV